LNVDPEGEAGRTEEDPGINRVEDRGRVGVHKSIIRAKELLKVELEEN